MTKQLIDGLAGAIGSRFLPGKNQLVFVEFGGKVSALDLLRPLDAVVFDGSATLALMPVVDVLHQLTFDCETGTMPV